MEVPDAWQRYVQFKRKRKHKPRHQRKCPRKRQRCTGGENIKVCEVHKSAQRNPEELWQDLRLVQRATACSTATLISLAKRVVPSLTRTQRVQADKKLMKRGGAKVLELHGCVHCDKHVFVPSFRGRHCPKCGGARFNARNKPHEVCQYFPLHSQLTKLLSLPTFRHALNHEYERPKNANLMTDVFDAPMWRKRFGKPTASKKRIVLQLCVDGIPAFAIKHSLSLKPVVFMMLSLPPQLRARAANMLLLMLIPAQLKGQAARKYYDFAATYELNALHDRGINGVRVMMYGNTLDTPGRAELLNIQVKRITLCAYLYIFDLNCLFNHCKLVFIFILFTKNEVVSTGIKNV